MPEKRNAGLLALAYLAMQAACAALAVYATWLYLTVLALHYIEYHLLMAPRCFGESTGPRAGVLGFLRRGGVFYSLMAVVIVLFEARSFVTSESLALRFAVHIFDGIFMLHYVLDAFLWKFHNPYYRSQLYPLYFQRRLKPTPVGVSRGALITAGAIVTAVPVALTVPPLRAKVSHAASSLQKRVIDPLRAEEYMRWGIHYAETGQLDAASHQLGRAAQLAPEDQRLQGWLRMLSNAQQTGHKQR